MCQVGHRRISQIAIGNTDHLIVGRQQSGVDNLNGHDSSFMAVSIVYIVSHHKWFHDQQKHTACKICKASLNSETDG